MKNPKLKQEIVLLLAVGIGIAVILNIVYDFEPFSFQYLTEMTSQELDLTIPDDNFVRFALAVQFGYDKHTDNIQDHLTNQQSYCR